jgi:rhodanese-related sulfurtransferase
MNLYPDRGYFDKYRDLPIIDIRTEGEWEETGILDGVIPITFFNEMGQYDIDDFLKKLHRVIGDNKSQQFALICRTGSRTGQISNFLNKEGYKSINLQGGMFYVMRERSFPIVPYDSDMDYLHNF